MITAMPRIAIAAQNFEQLLGLFRDKMHMPVLDLSAMSRKEYGAALAMCVPEGGSNIELMSPVDPDTPLCRSLQGFIDRRGEGLFALMLEAPVPDEEAEALAARGLNIMPLMPGAFGRDVHPNSTHGVLIRVYPVDSFKGRFQGEPDRRAPQLSGIVRVIVAVADIEHAAAAYSTGFGLAVDPIVEDRARGVAVAHCHPPKGGIIELVAVRDESRPFAQAIARHLREDREGMYALVLQSPDLQATAASLRGHGIGVRPAADDPAVLEIPRADAFGALIRIEAA
ncbi:MAG: VOC family protein [Pseudomonadales bacterium]|nr:VOC family protein [Pseudomonadales bacterium]